LLKFLSNNKGLAHHFPHPGKDLVPELDCAETGEQYLPDEHTVNVLMVETY